MSRPITKKRNPQDATLRNIRALKKAVANLELRMWNVYQHIEQLLRRTAHLVVTNASAKIPMGKQRK